jgi:4-hydroxy-tetrahydrodipicolinate synthase
MSSTRLGLSCAISTPFTPAGRVDTKRLADHANWCLREGCDSVTLFGTTGEGAAVGVADREASIKALLASGIKPAQLLSGVTACALDDAIAQAKVAMDAGLHGLLLTPPWYFRDVSDDGLFAWFSAFFTAMGGKARNTFLYHIPSMTGVPLSVDLVGRLKTAFPGVVVGVKDSSGSWENTEKLLAAHGDLQILVGDERQLARAVKQGGAGTICGLANLMPGVVRKAAHDGVDDPRIAQAVTAIMQFSFMPAVKALIAHQRNDAGWRTMAAPLSALSDAQAQKLIADFGKLSAAQAA